MTITFIKIVAVLVLLIFKLLVNTLNFDSNKLITRISNCLFYYDSFTIQKSNNFKEVVIIAYPV